MKKSLSLCSAGCRLFCGLWFKKFYDANRIPQKGKLVYACNHSSLLDGIVTNSVLNWTRFQATHTIAYKEPFNHWFMGYIMRSGRCIPFERGDAQSVKRMLRIALGWLKMEEAVALFPEGHLNDGKTLRLPRPGAAILALESGAPVMPLGLRGTREAFPEDRRPRLKRVVTLHAGQLIDTGSMSEEYHNSDKKRRAELIGELSLLMMRQISELSGQALHRRMR